MTLEEMQRRAQDALDNGWDKVTLPAEDVLALRPPPKRQTFWEWLKGTCHV